MVMSELIRSDPGRQVVALRKLLAAIVAQYGGADLTLTIEQAYIDQATRPGADIIVMADTGPHGETVILAKFK